MGCAQEQKAATVYSVNSGNHSKDGRVCDFCPIVFIYFLSVSCCSDFCICCLHVIADVPEK
jgi:hypothetical protein